MTENLSTIARPYALAAFEYALDKDNLLGWNSMLQTAKQVVQDKAMAPLLNSPQIQQTELAEVIFSILGDTLDTEQKNFIQLLAEYERLTTLPEIAKLFAENLAQHQKTITVEVISAIELDSSYQQKFIDALTRRLKRKVSLDCKVDSSLLGGAMIRAGDMVIDGSVRGKLNRLLESL